MTIDEIMELNAEGIEKRLAAIKSEMDADGADLAALTKEVEAIDKRKAEIKSAAEQRKALADMIAAGSIDSKLIATGAGEKGKGSGAEVRSSKAYIDAFAKYVRTGNDMECRKILSSNADAANIGEGDGVVPVPTFVDSIVRHAWENEPIMQLVHKTYLKGNISFGFERSATDAVIHAEGADAPAEEQLLLGVVTMVPKTIKKWISVSDEALDMNGEQFLSYIYAELTHKIAKKAADEVIAMILAAPATSTATVPGVPTMQAATGTAALVNAQALLSDEAAKPVVVMTKAKKAAIKAAALSAGYAFDPFDGMTCLTSEACAVTESGTTKQYAIVGDFASGFQANFPAGDIVNFVFDNLSLAEKDLVKIVGREPVALAVAAEKRFCVVEFTD